ncbi:MAG: DEAD/DEAH box helicase family protein [Ardenticatenaceae bacterium]|nr:DEAD/DEAH box helicase family protein [Ardenticatenaceae bacterium]
MSNFAFLNQPNWQQIYSDARLAENYVLSDPRAALLYGRRTVEMIVEWLTTYDPAFDDPYAESLHQKMTTRPFRENIPYGVQDKMHALRKIGNEGVHGARRIQSSQTIGMIRDLFAICHWFARQYTAGDPNSVPGQFDEALLPPPPRDVVQKTRAQLKLISEKFLERDEELKKLREELVGQRHAFALQEAELEKSRAQVATTKVVNEAIPDNFDYSQTEAGTRELVIDQMLRAAGWDVANAVTTPKTPADRVGNVTFEERVEPMPNRRGYGYADYVLWGADGLPLAVVEAKKTAVDKERGKHQAELYADALEKMTGQRPVIFYTNGYTVSLWDDSFYPPREVQGFYTQEELALLVQRRDTAKNLAEVPNNAQIAGRYYQEEAIRRVTDHFQQAHRRALLVMATGTGKTRTAVALVDLLMRANWVKRVLFLADRVTLVNQAVKAFKAHLPHSNPINLLEDKQAEASRVVVSTYHTVMNLIERQGNSDVGQRHAFALQYGVGHFDLIIIDEAHRSVYAKFGAIFQYFDGLLLGLTATPKDEVDRNTYELFNLASGDPTYSYDLDQAVADEFLVPPQPMETSTKFMSHGIRYDELPDEEKIRWEMLEWDESGEMPDAVDARELNQWLFNQDTIDKVLQTLMEHGLKVAGGDRLGKTIIFAANSAHARRIVERFDANYPNLAGKFAQQVDYSINYAQDLVEKFGVKEGAPHIAVSVDMLDTGVDVPEVVNLLFFKRVRSKTKFFQMIGRGTRLCEDLFGLDQDKTQFLIFDFCGNFEFFRYNPKGRPAARMPKPLRQQLFETRLHLLETLDGSHDPELIPLRQRVADALHETVAQMNLHNFLVRPKRPFVEPFQARDRWDNLSLTDRADLLNEVAALPSQQPDEDESAKRLDLLLLRLQLAALSGQQTAVDALRDRAVQAAEKLTSRDALNIPLVRAQEPLLRRVQTAEFWQEVTPNQLEDVRRNLRDLTRFIVPEQRKALDTNFVDELGEVKPTYLPEVASGVDKVQYKRRVERYIRSLEDTAVLQKIRWAMPLTPDDLRQLDEMLFAAEEVGSESEFAQAFGAPDNLARFIRSLVGLDRRAAKEQFADFLNEAIYTPDQIQFVNYIIEHLTKNGSMEPGMLYERPFTDLHDSGPNGLFSGEEMSQLLAVVRKVNASV